MNPIQPWHAATYGQVFALCGITHSTPVVQWLHCIADKQSHFSLILMFGLKNLFEFLLTALRKKTNGEISSALTKDSYPYGIFS